MAFWLTVKKLFKGKGVSFFRGYKGEGLGNVRISTSECKINFAVPSDPVLSKAAAPYRDDATEPGILNLTLDAFAKTHKSKDVKLSIDGKRLAIGFGRVGDEDMMGHEASPTLNEKKQRLKDELNLVQIVISSLPDDDLHNQQSLNMQEKDKKNALLIIISNMSSRIKELRNLILSRKLYLESLFSLVEGDWKTSCFAPISYWQTKILQSENMISQLLDCVDSIGYAVSCINGTSHNYVRGRNVVVDFEKQSNYICLRKLGDSFELAADEISARVTKQKSQRWSKLRDSSRITGSSWFWNSERSTRTL